MRRRERLGVVEAESAFEAVKGAAEERRGLVELALLGKQRREPIDCRERRRVRIAKCRLEAV